MKQLPVILSLVSLAVTAGAYDVSPSGLSDGTDAAAIQSAINTAVADGGGVVRLADGTYHLTSPVTVPAGVELVGNDANRTAVVLDGAGSYRLLDVTGNSALVHGVTFANGYSSLTDNWYHGPVYITAGTVSNCVHRGGRGKYTGALCLGPAANGAVARVADTVIYNCTGTDSGGAGVGGGLRLCGSKTAIAEGCTISNCWQSGGHAVYINNEAARLFSSTIAENTTGGLRIEKNAIVSNCVIRANSGRPGVQMANGTLRASLVTDNEASTGGGINKTGGAVIGCTVAGNRATVSAPGVYQSSGSIRDSIIWHNGSTVYLTDEASLVVAGGTCTYTCAASAPSGNGNISDRLPVFADVAGDDYLLAATSPCRGAASDGGDMGWRPYAAPAAPRVSFAYAFADGAAPATASFTAALEGDFGDATSYAWSFGDGATDTTSGATASHTYAAAGRYTVALTVETTRGGTLRYAVANAVNLGSDTVHVVEGAGAGVFPYATEATATSDILTAVNAVLCSASRPGRVIVHGGTFSSTAEQIILDKPVEVIGSGRDVTILDLNASNIKRRGFFLSHPLAVVRDLTVKRGYWQATEQNGAGGARIDAGLVSNCVFRSCKAQYIGSVCVNGANASLLDCEIHGGNHSDSGGAGRGGGLYMTAGFASGCIVSNCTGSSNGGGVYVAGGTVTNFHIRGCSVGGGQGRAGGLYVTGSSTRVVDVVVDGCAMKKNGGYGGGGVYIDNGTLTDAVVTNCSVTYFAGGGIYMAGGTVARTVVAECTAKTTGGGIHQTSGTLNHATVSRNSCDSSSGIHQTGGTIRNTIVFGNGSAAGSSSVNLAAQGGTVSYSCAPELTSGTDGNLPDNPLLRDAPAGDFRLLPSSPCIGAADDDGDMGAIPYVYDPTAGATLSLAVDVAGVISPVTATFRALLDGTPPAAVVDYVWTFGDGATSVTASGETTHTYSSCGVFSASVEVRLANGTSLSASVADAVGVWSDVAYVNPLSASPQSPYETPEKAATTLAEALSVVQVPAGGHATVYLEEGVYTQTAAITYNLTRPIRIASRSGRRDAVLSCGRKSVEFTLNDPGASVLGLVVSNTSSSTLWGAFTVNGGTVSNCAVVGTANGYAGGAFITSGLIADCLFKDCQSSDYNGTGMHAQGGLRIDGGVVERCVVTNCTSGRNAGGVQVRGGTFRDSVVAGCSGCGLSLYVQGGLVERCRILGNADGAQSGGACIGVYVTGGTVRNCLVVGNVSSRLPAGIRAAGSSSTVENCTITGNAGTSAGIVSDDSAKWYNCLSWNNAGDDSYGSAALTTCSVGVDPHFRDAAKGDYRLTPSSVACIDKGTLRDWMTASAIDLDGARRVRSRRVDIGCREFAANRTMLFLR